MDSGKAKRPTVPIIVTIGSLVLFCILSSLVLRSCQQTGFQLGLPASQGLPTAIPGQVLFPVPTATPPAPPTADPAATLAVIPTATPPVAAPATAVPSPVAPVATPGSNVIIPDTAPIPSDGQDQGGFIDDTGIIEPEGDLPEPFPEGSRPPSGPGYGSGVACNRRVVHVVRAGENLFRIALRYNTTTYAIARLNGITNVRAIRPGQRLTIITCRQGGSKPARGTYVVRPGDNLFRIGLRFGTTAADIRAANGLGSNLIVPGQVLRIP
jgi:LysM repeat protein